MPNKSQTGPSGENNTLIRNWQSGNEKHQWKIDHSPIERMIGKWIIYKIDYLKYRDKQ